MNQNNSSGISLHSLKRSQVGDTMVVVMEDGFVKLFNVTSRAGKPGRGGATRYTLRNVVTNKDTMVSVASVLPSGWVTVRRVSDGVNERTLRKATVPGPSMVVNENVAVGLRDIAALADLPSERPATPCAE